MARFAAQAPTGTLVPELEVLVRTAIFKPASAQVGYLLQAATDRIGAAYPPQPGQARKGRGWRDVQEQPNHAHRPNSDRFHLEPLRPVAYGPNMQADECRALDFRMIPIGRDALPRRVFPRGSRLEASRSMTPGPQDRLSVSPA